MEANTPKQPFQRRTIFIKKKLQLRYMALIILSVLCGLAIMTFEQTAPLVTKAFGFIPKPKF